MLKNRNKNAVLKMNTIIIIILNYTCKMKIQLHTLVCTKVLQAILVLRG